MTANQTAELLEQLPNGLPRCSEYNEYLRITGLPDCSDTFVAWSRFAATAMLPVAGRA